MLQSIWDDLLDWMKEWRREHRIRMDDVVDARAFFAAARAMAHLMLLRKAGMPDDRIDTTFPFIQCGRSEDGSYYISWLDETIYFHMEDE